jgi:murein DD-endopeptidase MepM/ murein hydrolase activator NlpD
MAESGRYNPLLVRGDGTRVLRLTLPRWVIGVTLGGVGIGIALVTTSLGPIYSDYLSLRHQRDTMAVLLAQFTEQQGVLESYQSRVREMQAEIAGWRDVHGRILATFGPDAGLSGHGAGIGGGTATSALDGDADRVGVKESLARLAGRVKEEGDNLRALEQFLARAGKVLASLPSRWPIRGPLNSEFGRRASPWTASSEFHSGIDVGAPIGTAVKAPAPGTVIFAGRQAEYGVTLIIDHGNDTKSLYGHLSKLNVAADQKIQRGDLVAFSGNTGRSSGPHLHYEIQVGGQPVNPNTYLWE